MASGATMSAETLVYVVLAAQVLWFCYVWHCADRQYQSFSREAAALSKVSFVQRGTLMNGAARVLAARDRAEARERLVEQPRRWTWSEIALLEELAVGMRWLDDGCHSAAELRTRMRDALMQLASVVSNHDARWLAHGIASFPISGILSTMIGFGILGRSMTTARGVDGASEILSGLMFVIAPSIAGLLATTILVFLRHRRDAAAAAFVNAATTAAESVIDECLTYRRPSPPAVRTAV